MASEPKKKQKAKKGTDLESERSYLTSTIDESDESDSDAKRVKVVEVIFLSLLDLE